MSYTIEPTGLSDWFAYRYQYGRLCFGYAASEGEALAIIEEAR